MNVVRLARAFAFGAPLAFLVAAYLTPPDPFSQLLFIAVGLPLFVAGAYVTVADSGNARTLLAFFGVILLTMVVGSLIVNALGGATGLRVAVLVVAIAGGAGTAIRVG